MLLLNIYVTTVIFSIIALVLLSLETVVYCKEHNIFRAHKLLLSRQLINGVKLLLLCIIPLYNVFRGVVNLVAFLHTPLFENAIQNLIDNGVFVKKEKESE